jgi:hypothetical protein
MIDQSLLAAALQGLELQKARLEAQIATVRQMVTGRVKPGRNPKTATEAAADPVARKKNRQKRKLSPEARERIAAAQKKRWAAVKGEG